MLAADCSMSLLFSTEFDHVTADTLLTFKAEGSYVKITALRNVSALKCYKSGTDKLTN